MIWRHFRNVEDLRKGFASMDGAAHLPWSGGPGGAMVRAITDRESLEAWLRMLRLRG